MRFFGVVGVMIGCLAVSGCATGASARRPAGAGETVVLENRQEAERALTEVVGAVSGQPMSQKELRALAREAGRDPETRSALEKISAAVGGEASAIKYCPVCGRRYSAQVTQCAVDHAQLEPLD